MRSLHFEDNSWFDCEALRQRDKRAHKTLVRILKEITRGDPATGIGKPEQLKYDWSGFWSRRISQKERIIYKFDDETVYIYVVGGHYD
ncbi:YoeB toxin protein [hydrothermal vent metagenome]|uniref:Putative mRNA interferase YoeB n=1 Tax=hydrothermal vent metagenome TaxID=652676 RepID=A0A3B0VCD3_9ZZZZ